MLVFQDGADPSEARVRARNLLRALKLLPSMQAGGDNLVDSIFDGLQELSRLKITTEQRWFIAVYNHEAVKIGDLESNTEVLKVIGPGFNEATFANALVQQEVEMN